MYNLKGGFHGNVHSAQCWWWISNPKCLTHHLHIEILLLVVALWMNAEGKTTFFMTCNLFIHMPQAAHATYVKCLCMPGMVGCSRSPFICSVQSEAWLVAHCLTSCTATSKWFKDCMLCSCYSQDYLWKGTEDISAVIVSVTLVWGC